MTLENMTFILGWTAALNYLVLLLWFLVYGFASDRIYALHRRWFAVTREQFSQLHYLGMMFYKLSIFLFLLAPYISLKIVPS